MFLSQSSSLPEGWRCGAEVSAGVKVSVDAFGLSLIPELLLKCASQCVGRLHHQCYAKGRGRASFDNTCKHLRHRRESAHKPDMARSEEHTSELQSRGHLVCRLLLEKKKNNI